MTYTELVHENRQREDAYMRVKLDELREANMEVYKLRSVIVRQQAEISRLRDELRRKERRLESYGPETKEP